MIDKLNAFLARFVGPNAAHMIDALIGLGIVGLCAYAYSAPARLFLLHHAVLGAVVTVGVPIATALASKFRKAAGSQASLVDEVVAAVSQKLAVTVDPKAVAAEVTKAIAAGNSRQ